MDKIEKKFKEWPKSWPLGANWQRTRSDKRNKDIITDVMLQFHLPSLLTMHWISPALHTCDSARCVGPLKCLEIFITFVLERHILFSLSCQPQLIVPRSQKKNQTRTLLQQAFWNSVHTQSPLNLFHWVFIHLFIYQSIFWPPAFKKRPRWQSPVLQKKQTVRLIVCVLVVGKGRCKRTIELCLQWSLLKAGPFH